jgi:hypothetical protein
LKERRRKVWEDENTYKDVFSKTLTTKLFSNKP